MKSTTNIPHIAELTSEELLKTSGGVAPVLVVGWAFVKGVGIGIGAAAAVHETYKAYVKATS